MFLGELFGHWFNDFIFSRHIRRSRGVYEPEVRLWMVWISVVLLIGSLVLYGYALADKLPWIGPVMAYGIYGFGLVTQTVAITGSFLCHRDASLRRLIKADFLSSLRE